MQYHIQLSRNSRSIRFFFGEAFFIPERAALTNLVSPVFWIHLTTAPKIRTEASRWVKREGNKVLQDPEQELLVAGRSSCYSIISSSMSRRVLRSSWFNGCRCFEPGLLILMAEAAIPRTHRVGHRPWDETKFVMTMTNLKFIILKKRWKFRPVNKGWCWDKDGDKIFCWKTKHFVDDSKIISVL